MAGAKKSDRIILRSLRALFRATAKARPITFESTAVTNVSSAYVRLLHRRPDREIAR